MNEISGLIQHSSQGNIFWTHNDSGDKARFYAIKSDGSLVATYNLPPHIKAKDIEDIAWQEENGRRYILLADIGDNKRNRPYVQLYRVPEPRLPTSSDEKTLQLDEVEVMTLHYPDQPQDAEALVVMPRSGEILIFSKHLLQQPTTYKASEFAKDARLQVETTLTFVDAKLPLQATTAADISSDGHWLLMRTYLGVFGFRRKSNHLPFTNAGCPLQSQVEAQGEAIAFLNRPPIERAAESLQDNQPWRGGFLTISEGLTPVLNGRAFGENEGSVTNGVDN
ncbi:MAG: hypothetical protein MK135_16850 [Polyangiaceae bacterium]|nr:hypothetical protein [Polyangiaceae bacterium]